MLRWNLGLLAKLELQFDMVNPPKIINDAFFEERSKLDPNTGCLEWTRHTNNGGYGTVKHKRKAYPAHRFAWIYKHGPVSDDTVICHKCDNPKCINVEHLFAGTALDNVRDKIAKGRLRAAKGDASGTAKLTSAQIEKIMADQRPQRLIAKEYDVSQSTISLVKTRKAWLSVDAKPLPQKRLSVRQFADLWGVPFKSICERVYDGKVGIREALRRAGSPV